MIDGLIFAFALVLLAAGNVVLASLIFGQRRRLNATAGQCARFERTLTAYGIKLGELTKQSPTNLAAEVVALADAVQRLRHTHQRFAGRFDQYVGRERQAAATTAPDDDDEIAAYLALQSAPPVKPGNGSP